MERSRRTSSRMPHAVSRYNDGTLVRRSLGSVWFGGADGEGNLVLLAGYIPAGEQAMSPWVWMKASTQIPQRL